MDHTKELIEMAHNGDLSAREQLVLENQGLVYSIARRLTGRGMELEDMVQLGMIGLIKAIDNFDLSFNLCFSTYAVPKILGEIKRFLRDDGMIKVSRTLKENGFKVRRASESLEKELGRDASIDEIAAATSLSREDIVMAMEANREVESINKSAYNSDGSEILLLDKLASNDNMHEKIIDRMTVNKLLLELDEKERELIILRYFKSYTQTQVAEILGTSQVQISRMEKKILSKMRDTSKL